MATQVQFRRGTTSQNNAFTGAIGEITYDTQVKTLRLHDGTTAGGGSTLVTLAASQTLTNKTLSTSSVWNGSAIGLGYGGTGTSITAAAGAIAYSTSSGITVNSPGTSGQLLQSAGTGTPIWVNASSLTAGSTTNATNATNIAGGSAGYLVYQTDTNTTGFIAPGTAGYVLQSTGASTAPSWVTSDITIGSTSVTVGTTQASFAGLNILAATGTSHWTIPNGTTAQRPASPAAGMIRYNSSQTTFEGYSSGAWSSLGGVKSVDGYTYIQAETSAGAGNGDLDFYAENSGGNGATQVGQWNRTNIKDYTGTLVGTQTTQNVFNTTATTVNAFGAATTLGIGAATGTLTIGNPTITGTNATTLNMNGASPSIVTTSTGTASVFNTNALTGNLFGASTATTIGATSGSLTLRNPTIVSSSSSVTLFNTVATTMNFAGAGTTIGIGATTGTLTLNNPTVVGSQTTVNLWNTTSTTVNAFGAGTTVSIGAASGTTTINNANTVVTGDLAVNGGDITTSSTTATVFNTTATTVNIGGAATTVAIGASSGTTTVNNNVTITGNLTVNGSTTTSSSQNTGYGDSLVDLHYTNGGVNTSDDGKDIGLVFNYFKTTDKNAYLIWSNSSQALEYYSTATDNGTIITGTLGNYKGAGFIYAGSTSGTTTLQATATAGTTTLTLPAATDTLVGKATTDTLTNKSIDLTNNTLTATSAQLRTALTDETGTGVAVFGTAPTISLPVIDNIKMGYTTTATAAGTTTLTASSNYRQFFTGTTTQTVQLPVTSTLTAGMAFEIENNSTGLVTVTASGGATVGTIPAGVCVHVVCIGTTLTTAADWDWDYISFSTITGTGSNVLSADPTFTGTLTAATVSATTLTETSDERLKTDIVPLANALNTVLSLEGKAFVKDGKASIGLIAQQVQKVLPQVVVTGNDEMQTLSVQYGNIVAVLIEAVKEQQKQIEELKAKLGN